MLGIGGLSQACTSGTLIPASCPMYCWESFLDVEDLPEDGMMAGFYPVACDMPGGGSTPVPHPAAGYSARTCNYGSGMNPDVEQNSSDHFQLKMAIANLIASATLTTAQADAYDKFVDLLDVEAYASCVAHLTCNGNPSSSKCDILPQMGYPGNQACTISSAESLCLGQVYGVLEDQLERPNPEQYPECSGLQYFSSTVDCEGFVSDMNGTGGDYCGEDGMIPGTGSTSMGSADTTGENLEPFGDVDMLVSCDTSDCDLDASLILNVMEHFSEFDEDAVTLDYVDDAACGKGVEVNGLSAGTPPTELADKFDVENGDIITKVNGIELDSLADFADVLQELDTETDFTVVVKRPDGMSCTTTTWTLEIVP